MPEPPPSQLRRLLKRPEARRRVTGAVTSLLAAALVGFALLGLLLIWHVVRRGRLIRERLGPPRATRLPEVPIKENSPQMDADENKNLES